MLILTGSHPSSVIVEPVRLLPRFWATAWSLGKTGRAYADTTLSGTLRHIDAFYDRCDAHFGVDSLDAAISSRDANAVQEMVEGFYLSLTEHPDYTTTTVQRWDAVRGFIQSIARRLAIYSEEWQALSALIDGTERIRPPKRGRFKFPRALPPNTLRELLLVADPTSDRNPFSSESVRWRNWLILHLLLLAGLRRGEALLLSTDSLKHGVDDDTGEVVRWLDVTTTEFEDTRATKPSIKTDESHRQVPVSDDLATLYENCIENFRESSDTHEFLLTSRTGAPLSAESVTKVLRMLSNALSPQALNSFREKTSGKLHISSHDLRHTCATARYKLFLAHDRNRELTLQRMRAFFGWSVKSDMPDLYARAAIQDDLIRTWNDLFRRKVERLRCLPN